MLKQFKEQILTIATFNHYTIFKIWYMIFYKVQYPQDDLTNSNTSHIKFSRKREKKKVLKRSLKHLNISDTGYWVHLPAGKWP